jgi:hypothetical protein
MFKKTLLSVIASSLFASSLFGEQVVVERDRNTSVVGGGAVSDIPYGYYIDSLSPQMMKVIDRLDLSAEEERRLFVGYGVYDKEDKHCKNLEIGITQHDFDLRFHRLKSYNGHSYAISRDPMSFTDCQALTAQFGGYVFIPGNHAENDAILGMDSRLYDENGWLGIYRQNCATDYKNVFGENQTYKNFYEPIDDCDSSKLFAYKKAGSSLWWKGDGSQLRQCIIEINSPDVTRPVQVCAPWWRIERTYKVPTPEEIFINGVSLDMYSVNQATLPMRMTTCLEYEDANLTDSNVTTPSVRDVICKTYYDMTMGPECIKDIFQTQCFVDTCEGYIKNVCSKNEIQPEADGKVKNYVWGYIKKNGIMSREKIKQNIHSYAYTCPLSPQSFQKCLLTGDVVVFPYQCDEVVCSAFKRCLGEQDKDRKTCHDLYPCEEVYGDATQPVVENGNLVGFRAKCGESMVVNRNIDKLSKQTDKCVKYETIVDVTTEQRKCTVTANEMHYEVETTITAPDIFANREDCVRINDIDTARPDINMTFEYVNNGFFNLALVKSYHDGAAEFTHTEANNSMAHDLQYMILKETTKDSQVTSGQGERPSECSSKFAPDWEEKRIHAYAQNNTSPSGLIGVLNLQEYAKLGCAESEVEIGDVCYLDQNRDGVPDAASGECLPGYTFTEADSSAETNSSGTCLSSKQRGVSSYRVLAFTKDGNYAQQLSTDMGLDYNIGNLLDYDNIDLSYIGVTKAQIKSGNVIVLGGDKILGDQVLDRFKLVDNGQGLEESYILADSGGRQISGEECQLFAKCNGFQVTSSYNHEKELGVCTVSNNSELDEVVPPATPPSAEYPEYSVIRDVLATSLNGNSDIFSVQEYADGKFGYASNFHFLLPKNNEVFVDGKEIFPIVPQYAIDLDLDYDYYVRQKTQHAKNKKPQIQQGSYEGTDISADSGYTSAIVGGIGVGLAAYGATSLLYAGPAGVIVGVAILYFSSPVKYGDFETKWSIQDIIPRKYVENVYGYDLRIMDKDSGRMIFGHEHLVSPTAERDDFEDMLEQHGNHKTASLYWQGYEKSLVDNVLLRPCEMSVCSGYPGKGHWYDPTWLKKKVTTDGQAVVPITKEVNNVYLGATNTVTIFVPYLGDYILTAYSQSGNILGQVVIESDDFLPATANRLAYSKVQFGSSAQFMLSSGMEDGYDSKACRYDDNVEWGGGVSGVYFENETPQGNDCLKSDDRFVQQNYAAYVTIKPVKANKEFRIDMIKPMPFSNRFYLVTFGELEKRKYTCYEKGAPCEVR